MCIADFSPIIFKQVFLSKYSSGPRAQSYSDALILSAISDLISLCLRRSLISRGRALFHIRRTDSSSH
uniref:Uncharacterized protein n=1 Tax=Anguilla anguilla TaxID=7936 RepID=A0A0E9QM36_ANGAN